jgi:hypothetical protein
MQLTLAVNPANPGKSTTNVPLGFSPCLPLVALNENVPAEHDPIQLGSRTPDPNAESVFGVFVIAAGATTSATLKTASRINRFISSPSPFA